MDKGIVRDAFGDSFLCTAERVSLSGQNNGVGSTRRASDFSSLKRWMAGSTYCYYWKALCQGWVDELLRCRASTNK